MKFGRGWDLDGEVEGEEGVNGKEGEGEEEDSLMDLISGSAGVGAQGEKKEAKGEGKGKGGDAGGGEEKEVKKRVDKGWGST